MDETNTQIPDSEKPGRNLKVGAFVLVALLLFATYTLGLKMGQKGYILQPKDFKVVNQADAPKEVDYGLLWKAIDVVNNNFIDKPISPESFLYGAVKGAVGAAGDQYTEYFTPQELAQFKTDLAGSFDGIGAEIGKQNEAIVIVAPLPETPAEKAGLQPKDVIVEVNGESTAGWGVEQAITKIRGKAGTDVTLTIYRAGRTDTFDVKITRAKIEIKSVKLEYKTQDGKKIAVLTVSRFGDDTKQLFDSAVNNILSSGAQGLVLDLRNDPGGYLETSVELASSWVPKGKTVVTESHSDQSKSVVFKSYGYGRLANMKTIVLINGGSASASEILAGALKDHGIAKLVGEKSFGKGSVQELIELPNNSGAVKVTIAKWVTPSGKVIDKEGLIPDIEVKTPENNTDPNVDPQLDRALQEISK